MEEEQKKVKNFLNNFNLFNALDPLLGTKEKKSISLRSFDLPIDNCPTNQKNSLGTLPFSALLPELSDVNNLFNMQEIISRRQHELLEGKNARESNTSRTQSYRHTAEELMLNQVQQWLSSIQGK